MNDTPQHSDRREEFDRVWGNLPGWGQLAAVNHTTIGLRFILTGTVFFLIGGLLAMLIRTQLALPDQDILSVNAYNQVFTMHGTVMMFLFAIPILEGGAMYLIPKMIGARDLVFPRLSALGYYCYLFGGIIVVSSLLLDMAPAAGWFMYPPLSNGVFSPGKGPDFWLLGITFVEISAISAGVELVVSILRTRTNGMSLRQMPIFCWYILAMALMIIFGFPPLILASIMLELERAADFVFFGVAGGGDPLLWQHLFWLFGHPEVYIIFFPAAGIVSTLLPVFAQRTLVGYRWIVLAIIVQGFISFGLWVHHMYTVGIPKLGLAFFSVASMIVAIPTGIQIFAWVATLWTGRVVFRLPMLWIIGFLLVFVCGGLTGVMLALVPFDWQAHDTHFVVAHMHYVLVGGMVFPLIAGFYYWLPHVSGRMPSETLGRWGFWLFFIGFNMTFLIMHLTGLFGMPRRVYTYEAGLGWEWFNLISSVGGFITALGVAVIIVDIALHFRFGRKAEQNPWNADSLEWAVEMPVTTYNFASLPEIKSRHPLWEDPDLPHTIATGQHGLPEIGHGRREIYGSDAVTGQLKDVIHLPSNSWIPLQAASMIAVVCLGLLTKYYWVALAGAVLALMFLIRWSWHNGAHPLAAPKTEDWERTDPPLHSRTFSGPGLWGVLVALIANGTLFSSLIFGWFYLWTSAPLWNTPADGPLSLVALTGSGILLTLAAGLFAWAVGRLRKGDDSLLEPLLWVVSALGAAHFGWLLWEAIDAPLTPTTLAHDSLLSLMLWYLLLQSGLATLASVLQALRVRVGYVDASLPYEPVVVLPLWAYATGAFWISFAAFMLLPMTWSGA
ncbi:cytochrome c oxidase subunit I+III [Halopseudomonas xinjiangensis]|uniref:cytochrome-c oxidase n=1 Tax=Halopseudomonas xinjiangensis TaxID=487184 RepID=A0A1H1VF55_9GAMM|nr:cytochrome c oxidase subunit I [Halopseudomonas xinjiangensis]SDS83305.1 cytochrome c oxidase subunit I+III [Halopseudomonas xinjiangensis]